MKFIISQILAALTLILSTCECQCSRELKKYRLSHIINYISDDKRLDYDRDDISKFIDIDCAKNVLNLPQNAKMIINEIQEVVLYVAIAARCHDEDKIFHNYVDDYIEGSKDSVKCMSWLLKQIEPSSKLLEDFKINDDDARECGKIYSVNQFDDHEKNFVKMHGPLDVLTCGKVTDFKIFLKIISTASIIRYGNFSNEIKMVEMEKLKKTSVGMAVDTASCIIRRFEIDPVGR